MNRPEQSLHIAAVAYLRAALPKPWFPAHVPNGGFRTKVEAGAFQRMGVLPGMPDLLIFGPGPRIVAIEFKAPPKRLRDGGPSKAAPRLSPAQRARQADLGACGIPYLVVDDLAAMIAALRNLGVPLRGRAL